MGHKDLATIYGRHECLADLTEKGYIAGPRYGRKEDAEFTVYVTKDDKAGGQLRAILGRHNYMPIYPKPSDHDDFEFEVVCEPACWHGSGYNFDYPEESSHD